MDAEGWQDQAVPAFLRIEPDAQSFNGSSKLL